MFDNLLLATLQAIVNLGSPGRWPRIARKLFVILFPITIPMLIAYWFGMIFLIIGVALVVIIGCIAAEGGFALYALWKKV